MQVISPYNRKVIHASGVLKSCTWTSKQAFRIDASDAGVATWVTEKRCEHGKHACLRLCRASGQPMASNMVAGSKTDSNHGFKSLKRMGA